MAWVNFQKSNWTRGTAPMHARQYFPASVQSTVTGNLTFAAGATKLITLTATFQFQGNGPVFVTAPEGVSNFQTAAAQGVVIENAYLTGPASGSYAAGNHPLIVVGISAASALTTAATGFDLIAWQY
jgi:hypothetical protein